MPVVVLSLTVILAAQTASIPEARDLRTVYVCLLSRGPAWTADPTADVQRLQQAHADYLAKLATSGELLASGPIAGEGDLRGLVLIRTDSFDSARRVALDDPAVKARRLAADVVPVSVAASWFTQTPAKDDAAIRQFVVGLTRPAGPGTALGPPPADRPAYLWRLRQAGTLVFAGDAADGSGRGLQIFASDNVSAIRTIAADDPAVRANQLVIEWQTWYAPEGVFKTASGGLMRLVARVP